MASVGHHATQVPQPVVDDPFNGLARKDKFFGSLYGFFNRYFPDWFSIFCCPGGYGSVNGRRTIKKRRKPIMIFLNLVMEFFQKLFEQVFSSLLIIPA